MLFSRRDFIGGGIALASLSLVAQQQKSFPFRLAVINDEITPDFEHACYVASHDFGLEWIELRTLWGKSLTDLGSDQVAEVKKILVKYGLRVTDLASPLFKTDLPGAPLSKESPRHDTFKADFTYKEQSDLLEHLIELSKIFGTDRIRCFDFWRLEDQKPFRAEMDHKLYEAAETCRRHGLILLLENEMACNTGSGVEAAETLKRIPNDNLMLNWDAANSGTFAADKPYPDDYERLPKQRIGHVHCKNVVRRPGDDKNFDWEPVDIGVVDWVGQFKALKRDGYSHGVSLETHWRGGPGRNAEEVSESSTRISMNGLKKCLAGAGLNA